MINEKIHIIGAGRHAKNNLYPALALFGANVASVTTTSIEHSRAAARQFGFQANAYADIGEMLRSEPGGRAVIAMQAHDAVEAVLACLDAGKQVFVEKPCGLNLQQAEQIYHASERSGKGVCVGFMKRFAPVYVKLKQLLDEKGLGEAYAFQASFRVDAHRFCANNRDFTYYVAIHMLDLLRFIFGEVQQLTAVKNETGDGCSYAVMLAMQSGVVGSLNLENRTAWTRESEQLCVTCADGFVQSSELNALRVHTSHVQQSPWQTLSEHDEIFTDCFNPASGCEKDLYLRGFAGEMRYFAETLLAPSEDNLHTTQLCEMLLSALKE